MPVLLPSQPSTVAVTPQLVDFGGVLTPPLGGEQQRLNRLGNRWALAVTLPPLPIEPLGREWLAALNLGISQGVVYPFPQIGFDTANQTYLEHGPNLWSNPNAPNLWPAVAASYSSAGLIEGFNAGLFTVTSTPNAIVLGDSYSAVSGEALHLEFSALAGSASSVVIGVLNGGSFGAAVDLSVSLVGPGSVTDLGGGLYQISGLSGSLPTRVTLIRANLAVGSATPRIYLGSLAPSVGDSIRLFNPISAVRTVPTSPWLSVGTPLVNGAGQIGSTINLDGFSPDYLIRQGQFFSIVIAGQRYLYQSASDTAATAGGEVALSLTAMIRKPPPDNAVCEFAAPMIEGFLPPGWSPPTIDVARMIGLEFTIMERG